MIYNEGNTLALPKVDILTLLFEHGNSEDATPMFAEAHDPSNVITKKQCRELTQQIAHFLRTEYGIGASGPGKDIVVGLSNGQRALPCIFYGTIAAEGVYSAAATSGTAADVARQIKGGPASVLICGDDVLPLATEAAKAAGLPGRNVLVLKSWPEISLAAADGSVKCDFRSLLPWKRITDPAQLDNDTVCILYSSGTTGLPKGVRISHTNLCAEAMIPSHVHKPVRERWAAAGKPVANRSLGHLPTAHIAGLQGYFVNPFYDGNIVYWMPKFNFDDFVKYCETLRITHFFSVPPIWMGIAKHPAVNKQLAAMQWGVSGAAPLSGETQSAAMAKLPPDTHVHQIWGLSETTGTVTAIEFDEKPTPGALGYLMPNITMRLVGDDGRDVKPGEAGEAYIKGPVVTKGYWKNPEADRNAFTDDGWFKTGDILRVEKGLLYIVDRKKELIKYKGLQVAPAELEGLLIAHPAVMDAAVIGVAQNDNEVPRAFVVLAPGSQGKVSEEDLSIYVKQQVAAHKQLRGGVVFVDVVPRSPSGKILRRVLREQDVRAKL